MRPIELATHLAGSGLVPRSYILDHDGTLARFRADPSAALPSGRVLRIIGRLISAGAPVCVLSGRPVAFLMGAYGSLGGLDMVGSHGAEVFACGEVRSRPGLAAATARLGEMARAGMSEAPPGLLVEVKSMGVAVHVRAIPPAARARWLASAEKLLRRNMPRSWTITPGDCVVEARAGGTSKGDAVRSLLERRPVFRSPVAVLGDDIGDEDAFVSVGRGDVPILVSRHPRPSHARFRLAGTGDVARFLETMLSTVRR